MREKARERELMVLTCARSKIMAQPRPHGGGEWQSVVRNHRRKSVPSLSSRRDMWKNSKGDIKGSRTTFFFIDFGEGWRAKDLFFEFKELGVIDEIVIPSKKDWSGQKYGFVRYVNVEDERIKEVKLNNTWLDGRKLKRKHI